MNARHRAREIALQILYQIDLITLAPTQPILSDVLKDKSDPSQPFAVAPKEAPQPLSDEESAPTPIPRLAPLSATELTQRLMHHYEHFQVPEDLREFIGELVLGTLEHEKQLDAVLQKHASNWRISRMSSLDRSLLRMALYEMNHLKKVAREIVINEAVELAKQFGTADTPAFVNGVLDSIDIDAA